jgi:S1-C subfamily serine protease
MKAVESLAFACCLLIVTTAFSAEGAAREAADRARTKIVILKTVRRNSASSATGFVARPTLAVTAAHAVAQTTSITAWLNGVSYPARVVSTHSDLDLAVLRLNSPELQLKPLTLATSSESVTPQDELFILAGPAQGPEARGEPRDRVLIPAIFRRRGPMRDPDGKLAPMLTLDASVERGDSGSPVIRVRDGAVVGVLSSRELPDADGVSRTAYAVPVEAVTRWLDDVTHKPDADDDFYLFRLPR